MKEKKKVFQLQVIFSQQVLPWWERGIFDNCRFCHKVASWCHKSSYRVEGSRIQSCISHAETTRCKFLSSRYGQNGIIELILWFLKSTMFYLYDGWPINFAIGIWIMEEQLNRFPKTRCNWLFQCHQKAQRIQSGFFDL